MMPQVKNISLPTVALVLLAAASSFAQPPTSKKVQFWTEGKSPGLPRVRIPSIAPLVKSATRASLVVSITGDPQLPKGHPVLPQGPGGILLGQGAGFIIHRSGYALTNLHVVEGAQEITVRVGEARTEVRAELVGADKKTDVALLRLLSDRKDWPVIPLGSSKALAVGDFVVAIGNPFGLAQSASMGIVSGRGRRDVHPTNETRIFDFIQTDASINPGNSGGPLLNLSGEAIGMNTAMNAAAQGIGFAIPIDMVKAMLPALREEGRFARSWLGVDVQRVSQGLAAAFGLSVPTGALVRHVVPEGPSEKAGILPGDIILDFAGRPIEDATLLPILAGDAGVGESVTLMVLRKRKRQKIQVRLTSHPDNDQGAESISDGGAQVGPQHGKRKPPESPSIGIKVVDVNDDDRRELSLNADVSGIRIIFIRPNSVAFREGLEEDDVVFEVNGTSIRTSDDFVKIAAATPPGGVLALNLIRRGERIFVAVPNP